MELEKSDQPELSQLFIRAAFEGEKYPGKEDKVKIENVFRAKGTLGELEDLMSDIYVDSSIHLEKFIALDVTRLYAEVTGEITDVEEETAEIVARFHINRNGFANKMTLENMDEDEIQ